MVIDREQALAASEQALTDGVRIGMRKGGVLSVCPEAELHMRSESTEQAALESIALSLLQYTPEVAYAEQHTLLLDVTASLRIFGGRLALCRRMHATIEALGFTLRLGMAPTARGAWLLANHAPTTRQKGRRRVVRLASLLRRLDQLPYQTLPAAQPFAEWIEGIGARTLQDLRRLPRAGLKRRCNEAVLRMLDCAYGEEPELFEWVQAPEVFDARLELPDRIEHAEAVLFAARRLLLQMTGWLVARQLAVGRFTLEMEHERGRQAVLPTPLEIVLAEPTWQEAHLTRLLKERLARLQLSAPVIAVRLIAAQMEAMAPPTDTLFPEPGGTPADFNRLLELLVSRLGEECVRVPALRADHRPEICNRWEPAAQGAQGQPPRLPGGTRPFWLLEVPAQLMVRAHRPFYNSPLQMVSPPERIECGWWDGNLIVRDYFIAQGSDAVNYWVYRERIGDDIRWYLHGLFG